MVIVWFRFVFLTPGFPRKRIEDVSTAVLYHMQFKDAPKMRKSTLRRVLMRETFLSNCNSTVSTVSVPMECGTFTIS